MACCQGLLLAALSVSSALQEISRHHLSSIEVSSTEVPGTEVPGPVCLGEIRLCLGFEGAWKSLKGVGVKDLTSQRDSKNEDISDSGLLMC